jgi:hypothetical protein
MLTTNTPREHDVGTTAGESHCDDQAASQRVNMDFVIPSEAPGYRISPDEHVRLVPLTMMRRKTLVSFGVADVDGRARRGSSHSNRAGQAFQTADLRNSVRAPWVTAGML